MEFYFEINYTQLLFRIAIGLLINSTQWNKMICAKLQANYKILLFLLKIIIIYLV